MDFKTEKNGYDRREVDSFISKLKIGMENSLGEQKLRISDMKREMENLTNELAVYKKRNGNISDALVVAVETAKQIENSSKNIYELEIKRVRALYNKWENFLNEMMKEYPKLSDKFDTKKILDEFNGKIEQVIKENSVPLESAPKQSPVGIRNLISKMSGLSSVPSESQSTKYIIRRNVKPAEIDGDRDSFSKKENSEKNYFKEISTSSRKPEFLSQSETVRGGKDSLTGQKRSEAEIKIKPISNIRLNESERFENLVDKFLNGDSELEKNAYTKALLSENEEDFDLKEALNPTEDLAEIMKSFDFFESEEPPLKKKKNK